MVRKVHGVDFVLDELLKLALVDGTETVETGTTHDFLLEAFKDTGALLPTNQYVDTVHAA